MSDKNIDWLKRFQLLLKALEKNGVKTDVWVELETKISGYELDFTEHDKVFENMISMLEEAAEWKAEAREIKKNRDEQLKSFRKAVEPYVDIGHMHETIAELKQRIAELESENEKLFDYLNGITGNTKAEIKNNIKNIEKIDKKPTKRTGVIVARVIDGQEYVRLDDFMSVVNDFQAEIGT